MNIMMINGKREIVARPSDFCDLIRTHMGEDAAQYFQDHVAQITDDKWRFVDRS